jgi:hypothetical protein
MASFTDISQIIARYCTRYGEMMGHDRNARSKLSFNSQKFDGELCNKLFGCTCIETETGAQVCILH